MFAALFAEDLEFYHDQDGLSVGRQATIEAVKNNICGKVHRDLIPGRWPYIRSKVVGRSKPERLASTAMAAGLPVSLWQDKNGV